MHKGAKAFNVRAHTDWKANKLTGDDCSGDETEQRHRFDGPSKRFAKVDPSGYGELTLDIQKLDAAISAAEREEAEELKLAEEMLEEWLRRQRELDGE